MLVFIIFILILSVLVLVHELGHFYAAKKCGVRVEEFGFGIPPKIFSKKYGETEYSINLLPFGGFVKLTGEDELDLDKALKDERNFMSKSALQRSVIITAGVIMNFLLAVILYYVFFAFTNFRSFAIPLIFDHDFKFGEEVSYDSVILGVEENTSAESAGLEPGYAVISIDSIPVSSLSDVREVMKDKPNQEVTVELLDLRFREGTRKTVTLTSIENEDGDGILGVYIGSTVFLDYSNNKLLSGPLHTLNVIDYSISTFWKLIKSSFEEKTIEPVSSSVSGPVGIFSVVGSILDSKQDVLLHIINLMALLSASLAFINIIPFPALDGGRLLFILLEKVIGRKLNTTVEAVIHKLGFLLLISLIILVTIRDISRLFM